MKSPSVFNVAQLNFLAGDLARSEAAEEKCDWHGSLKALSKAAETAAGITKDIQSLIRYAAWQMDEQHRKAADPKMNAAAKHLLLTLCGETLSENGKDAAIKLSRLITGGLR